MKFIIMRLVLKTTRELNKEKKKIMTASCQDSQMSQSNKLHELL